MRAGRSMWLVVAAGLLAAGVSYSSEGTGTGAVGSRDRLKGRIDRTDRHGDPGYATLALAFVAPTNIYATDVAGQRRKYFYADADPETEGYQGSVRVFIPDGPAAIVGSQFTFEWCPEGEACADVATEMVTVGPLPWVADVPIALPQGAQGKVKNGVVVEGQTHYLATMFERDGQVAADAAGIEGDFGMPLRLLASSVEAIEASALRGDLLAMGMRTVSPFRVETNPHITFKAADDTDPRSGWQGELTGISFRTERQRSVLDGCWIVPMLAGRAVGAGVVYPRGSTWDGPIPLDLPSGAAGILTIELRCPHSEHPPESGIAKVVTAFDFPIQVEEAS